MPLNKFCARGSTKGCTKGPKRSQDTTEHSISGRAAEWHNNARNMNKPARNAHNRNKQVKVTRVTEGPIAVRLPRSEPLPEEVEDINQEKAETDAELKQLQQEYRRLCTIHRQLRYAHKLSEQAAEKQIDSYQVAHTMLVLMLMCRVCSQRVLRSVLMETEPVACWVGGGERARRGTPAREARAGSREVASASRPQYRSAGKLFNCV